MAEFLFIFVITFFVVFLVLLALFFTRVPHYRLDIGDVQTILGRLLQEELTDIE